MRIGLRSIALSAALLGFSVSGQGESSTINDDHAIMLTDIAHDFNATVTYTGRLAMQASVAAAMAAVPRHQFVTTTARSQAYINRPLSIGHGQTISQPFIVALMTDLLDLQASSRVLEIGTGSGYQAAILAEISSHVYSIEIIAPLAAEARERLDTLGYSNVEVRTGDGNLGWPEAAPFDAIIVTAAGKLPPALIEQLAPGGRMVIPIDDGLGTQMLTVIINHADGEIEHQRLLPVRFVPLTGDN